MSDLTEDGAMGYAASEFSVTVSTWLSDSYGLYDYESSSIESRTFRSQGRASAYRLVHRPSDPQAGAAAERVDLRNPRGEPTRSSDIVLLHEDARRQAGDRELAILHACDDGSYRLFPTNQCPLWIVANNSPLEEGDLIKLGRCVFAMRRIEIQPPVPEKEIGALLPPQEGTPPANEVPPAKEVAVTKPPTAEVIASPNEVVRVTGLSLPPQDSDLETESHTHAMAIDERTPATLSIAEPPLPLPSVAGSSPPSTPDSASDSPCEPRSPCKPEETDVYAGIEGKFCRVCLCEDEVPISDPLLTLCICSGSMQWIHLKCLRVWMKGRLDAAGAVASSGANAASVERNAGSLDDGNANNTGGGEDAEVDPPSAPQPRSFFWRPLCCELCQKKYPTYVFAHGRRPVDSIPGADALTTANKPPRLRLDLADEDPVARALGERVTQNTTSYHTLTHPPSHTHTHMHTQSSNDISSGTKGEDVKNDVRDEAVIELFNIPKPKRPFVVLEALPSDECNQVPGFHFLNLKEDADGLLRIGRGHGADLRISDISVSRLHAYLKLVTFQTPVVAPMAGTQSDTSPRVEEIIAHRPGSVSLPSNLRRSEKKENDGVGDPAGERGGGGDNGESGGSGGFADPTQGVSTGFLNGDEALVGSIESLHTAASAVPSVASAGPLETTTAFSSKSNSNTNLNSNSNSNLNSEANLASGSGASPGARPAVVEERELRLGDLKSKFGTLVRKQAVNVTGIVVDHRRPTMLQIGKVLISINVKRRPWGKRIFRTCFQGRFRKLQDVLLVNQDQLTDVAPSSPRNASIAANVSERLQVQRSSI